MIPNGSNVIRNVEDLGEIVRQARRSAGLQQEDLATAARTGRRFISELERGKGTVQLGLTLRVLEVLGLQATIDIRLDPYDVRSK